MLNGDYEKEVSYSVENLCNRMEDLKLDSFMVEIKKLQKIIKNRLEAIQLQSTQH